MIVSYLPSTRQFSTYLIVVFLLLSSSCSFHKRTQYDREPAPVIKNTGTQTQSLQYVLQFGAFSKIDNALNFTDRLKDQGLEAYYFIDTDGLYKVRSGNYTTAYDARKQAERLISDGIIAEYYLVQPSSYVVNNKKSEKEIRNKIVQTANRFIGVPYKWGGTSAQKGFDCSGLSMVVYNLNGLNLPRVSKSQYNAGSSVSKQNIRPADLLFFSTDMSGNVNHVGIYAGNGKFIHAPRSGKKIKYARINSSYFKKRYVGARSYL